MYAFLLFLAPHAAPPVGFDALGRERDAVVLVFVSVDCPLAKLYAPRLDELARRYAGRAAFAAVASDGLDGPADRERFARLHALSFPVLADPSAALARRFGARRSPEAIVLDRSRRVAYRGRIDDQFAVGVQRPRATKSELCDALDAVLAGRPVAVPVTEAPGCPLPLPDAGRPDAGVTYSRDVAPLLQRRCQVCHRPGRAGPFSLMTYAQAAGRARAVREAVAEGRMPPWGADPKHGSFANDPSLTPDEKRTLDAWVDAGCPEGDPADLPPPRAFADGWTIAPDLVLETPPFSVPAQGVVEYQHVRVDPGFSTDRWASAVEVRPSNPAVLHHCNVFLQPPGIDDPQTLPEAGNLGSYCLAITAPGTPAAVFPPGMAKRIPAGWRVVFVLHYQTVGSVQTDTTRLGLAFADPASVRKEVATKLMYDADLRIPPGEPAHAVSQTWQVRKDVLLLSLYPHAHLRGKSFRYELLHADGREETLLSVPRYDFYWQHRYELARPRRVAAGSRIRVSAVFDNSAGNPHNPDPTAEVRAGVQSWDEMFNGYFDVALADEDLRAPVPWHARAWAAAAWACRPTAALLACAAGGLYLGRRRVARWLKGRDEGGPPPSA